MQGMYKTKCIDWLTAKQSIRRHVKSAVCQRSSHACCRVPCHLGMARQCLQNTHDAFE